MLTISPKYTSKVIRCYACARIGAPHSVIFGGFSADAIKVFQGINGALLLAAGALVFFLLALIYRSPLFLWIPLMAVLFAEGMTRSVGYLLTEAGVTVNGQSASILSVLVLGAGTDYALLLVARYREELRRHEDKHEALALALRSAGPAAALGDAQPAVPVGQVAPKLTSTGLDRSILERARAGRELALMAAVMAFELVAIAPIAPMLVASAFIASGDESTSSKLCRLLASRR